MSTETQFINNDRETGKEFVKYGLELIYPFGIEAEEFGELLVILHDHIAYGNKLHPEDRLRLFYLGDLGYLISD